MYTTNKKSFTKSQVLPMTWIPMHGSQVLWLASIVLPRGYLLIWIIGATTEEKKDGGLKWVQAGRRDNWWTETSCVLNFFCMEEKAFEKSYGRDCCLQKRKRFCESRVPAAVVHLFSDYTITTILYYIHQMGSAKKKIRSISNARLPCLPCSSFRPYPMPGFPRESGLGKQGCRQNSFWHKQS